MSSVKGRRLDLMAMFSDILEEAAMMEELSPRVAACMEKPLTRQKAIYDAFHDNCHGKCYECEMVGVLWTSHRTKEAFAAFGAALVAQVAAVANGICPDPAMAALKAPMGVTEMISRAIQKVHELSGVAPGANLSVEIHVATLIYLLKNGPILEPEYIEVRRTGMGVSGHHHVTATGVYTDKIMYISGGGKYAH